MPRSSTTYKPGHKASSPGRPPLSKDILKAKHASYEELILALIEIKNSTANQLAKLDMDKIPMVKRSIINAYMSNDYRAIKDYDDRLYGRAKESIDLNFGDSEFGINHLAELEEIRKQYINQK